MDHERLWIWAPHPLHPPSYNSWEEGFKKTLQNTRCPKPCRCHYWSKDMEVSPEEPEVSLRIFGWSCTDSRVRREWSSGATSWFQGSFWTL